jgi:hypothetical protein
MNRFGKLLLRLEMAPNPLCFWHPWQICAAFQLSDYSSTQGPEEDKAIVI